ncbi:hypothetical protein C8J57DRAFT_1303404 [Mycena rebaudengoi]|nr:hypothetical protein C8J57DRAFT_1303404 [Mycena rebaudengoi]
MSTPTTVTLAQLTVPIFVGTVLNWAFFGVLCVQVCIYFIAFSQDPKLLKSLVGFICVAEVVQIITDTRNTVRIFGAGWGNHEMLDEVGWAWFSTPIFGTFISSIGQLFFAWRIHTFSKKHRVPALIATITAAQMGAGIWTGIQILNAKNFSVLQEQTMTATTVWLTTTCSADLTIVAGMVYYLVKSRTAFQQTNIVLARLIGLTVETGVPCAVFALVDLLLFAKFKSTNYHLAVCIGMSKAYSNSVLLILNSRAIIKSRALSTEPSMHFMSDVMFKMSETATSRTAAARSGVSHSETHELVTMNDEESKIAL